MFRKAIDNNGNTSRSNSRTNSGRQRWIFSCIVLLLVAAPFLFGMSQPSYATARSQNQVEASVQQQAVTSLGDVLNADGTINVQAGFSGSLDPKGWRMVNEAGKAPRFVSTVASSGKDKSPQVPGDEKWDERFVLPGTNNSIRAIAVSSSGDIYVGGSFTAAGGVAANNIAKWNGNSWSALYTGTSGPVNAISISSNLVFVGGTFATAGGITVNNICVWFSDTDNWSAFNSGSSIGTNGTVNAIGVPVAGNVYIGGSFTTAGGVSANNIAKWTVNTGWTALGSGTNAVVNAIAPIVENGSIFVGGAFTSVGGTPASRIAVWNSASSTWEALGSGVNGPVYAMAVKNTSLYVGGAFTSAGGVPANNVAKLEGGITWSAMGTGANGLVYGLAVSGSGEVYMGGTFTNAGGTPASRIARWNGSAWSALSTGVNDTVQGLALKGNDLFAAGQFTIAGAESVNRVGKWNSSIWTALGYGVNNNVHAIAVSGNDVYVAGSFNFVGGVPASHIARWDGFSWHALGSGTNGSTIYAIAVSGSNVYVGGSFTTAGGVSANNVAKWNGSAWSALGTGTTGAVYAIAISGSDVYVGGSFNSPSNNIAKWSGSAWSPLLTGTDGGVWGIAVSGSNIYVVGGFQTASGVLVKYVAMWSGSGWSPLGVPPNVGINGPGWAVAVDGSDVYIVGHFNMAGTLPVHNVAKWNGSAWAAIGSVEDDPFSVAVSTSGEVYVGGLFTLPGSYISMWNGSSWQDLGSGTDGTAHAIAISGNDVYVGGTFNNAGGKPSAHLGLWHSLGEVTVTPTPIVSITPTRTPTPGGPTVTPAACGTEYADVPAGSTFYSYVMCLSCRGLISGYPCGGVGEPCNGSNSPYFRPNVPVTRGQLSKIVSNAAGFNEDPNPQIFEDVPPGSTFYDWINRLARRGYMSGYACGTLEPCVLPSNMPYFRPGNQGTRGQLAKIVSNAAGFNDIPSGQIFSDVGPGSTFYDYVQRLASRGIIGGYPCGGVNPGTGGPEPCDTQNRPYYRTGNEVTRGQVSKIAVGAFFPSCVVAIPTPTAGSTATPAATPACSTNTYTWTGPFAIPEQGSLMINLAVVGGGIVQDVDFTALDVTHSWIGDVRLSLKSPAGSQSRMRVVDQVCNGGQYADFSNITLDDSASQGIGSICPPAAGGTYRPSEPLSMFNGQNPNGLWEISVEDLQAEDLGTINSFGLRITTCQSEFVAKP